MGIEGLGTYSSAGYGYGKNNTNNQKSSGTSFSIQAGNNTVEKSNNTITASVTDLIKMMENSRKLSAKGLKEDKDWREMSDDEWDKMLDGIDKYLEAFKKRVKEMEEMQEEAAKEAAAKADPELRAIAASEAALAVASGFGSNTSAKADEEDIIITKEGADNEKNWTKKLKTDDQTILMIAKEAQKMEENAISKFQELQITGSTSAGINISDEINESVSVEEDEELNKIWVVTTYTETGIICNKCKNGKIIDSWEIKYTNPSDSMRVLDYINNFNKDENLTFTGSKEFWRQFLESFT